VNSQGFRSERHSEKQSPISNFENGEETRAAVPLKKNDLIGQ
jgi:hypothetical protein